jgi:exonuclease SbcD
MLHFADLHVGMENYGRLDPSTGTSSRVRDFLDRMDEVIDFALANEVDVAVFAGDAFKNRDPEPTQQREFAKRIKKLADHAPTLLLVGNHDMPGMSAKANSLDIFRALDVPGVIVGHAAEGQVVETRRGPVYLAWLPYPMRNRLLTNEQHQDKNIDQLENVLRSTVSDILERLAEQAVAYEMPRVLCGHFSVAEAKLGSERSVMLGRDVAVFKSTLSNPVWDYVALGHIHRHQELNPGEYPSIVYSGSLERIDFGEEAEPKGFCWIKLARGESSWEFVQVAARQFKTIQLDVRETENPQEAVLEELQSQKLDGVVVRLQIQLRQDQEASLYESRLANALEGASSYAVEREVAQEVRARLGDLTPETLTPLELIEEYFRNRGIEKSRIEALMLKAEDLLNASG